MSCNNDSENDTSTHDSSGHGSHTATDSTSNDGESMMVLMERNMEQMQDMRSTGNADRDFAALMKTHHMGAVVMARRVLARGSDPAIHAMAEKMIADQDKEIKELDAFLSGNNTTTSAANGDAFFKASMDQMKKMNMDMDHSGSIDRQFLQMMIPHHQGGIDMARTYLQHGASDAKLKSIANNIISSQQKEITEMQGMLQSVR